MKGYSMISTGFSALDNCIGGLKKGKLYTLAGFNFTPPWIVEHFAALAHAALQELGYSAAEVAQALKGVDPNATTEEMVRYGLRQMVLKS